MIELIPTKELKKIVGGVTGGGNQGGPPHSNK
ncbi:hypothetical protein N481_07520 [Pseudoalteromonas luteoviolacea S4047-1]|uniref:Uncharacterized protein n=1 Tax=Pseudoalteromonas luteoviolacea S4054 TaxID=1129367 RepID=A0A0F6AEG1_9GAMM|nr:hypothetical protein N479_09895 [Pseudoalteromonas luteoviolacea S4054]KZN76194.1 hypothetical protein N481_07520 [Pseudoalteromonas luteoviolacea S4047-1]